MKTNLYDLLSSNNFLFWASIPTQLFLMLLHTGLKPNYQTTKYTNYWTEHPQELTKIRKLNKEKLGLDYP